MTLLVRAIVRSGDAARVAAAELVPVRADGLVALVSRMITRPPLVEAELRAHDALTRRIHELVPSLPARFGQDFPDEATLIDALRARRDELHAALDRVGGRVELAVTLHWRRSPRHNAPHDTSSGRRYLEGRAMDMRVRERADEIVGCLAAELSVEQAFVRHETCSRRDVAAIVAFLIDRDEIEVARERVGSFGERSADVSTVVDGVFAPYSFVA